MAPVYTKGTAHCTLYLPEGMWCDFWTNERRSGGEEITRRVHLATRPIYVRVGAIVPMDPVRQYTDQPADTIAGITQTIEWDGTRTEVAFGASDE